MFIGCTWVVGCSSAGEDYEGRSKTLNACDTAEDPEACYVDALYDCLEKEDHDQCQQEVVTARENDERFESGCWVTGGGHLGGKKQGAGASNQDSFGGNAMGMKDGSIRGEWQNTTHTGVLIHGRVDSLRCWRDDGEGPDVPKADPNNAEFGGKATVDGQEGFRFVVHVQDRAEGGHFRDTYTINVTDSAGRSVYKQDQMAIYGGNIQIHPPNGGHPSAQ